ncbi:hypothetical protein BGX23_002375, partial [Mortierella sp. AD031]
MTWFLKAAKQGHVIAQNRIGLLYEMGHGVTKDYSKAAEWFIKAATQGHATVQSNVGIMHERGRGVPQDYKAAM